MIQYLLNVARRRAHAARGSSCCTIGVTTGPNFSTIVVLARPLDDALDGGLLVTGREQEPRRLRPDILVVVELGVQPVGALRIRAFADEVGLLCVEASRRRRDRLVHLTERGLGPRHLLVIHVIRLPDVDRCLRDNVREAQSVTHADADERDWPEPVQRVSAVLRAAAVDARIEEFAGGTPSAREAAQRRRLRARADRQVARARLRRRLRARARPGRRPGGRGGDRAQARGIRGSDRPAGRGRARHGLRAGRGRAVPAARGHANPDGQELLPLRASSGSAPAAPPTWRRSARRSSSGSRVRRRSTSPRRG